MQVQLLSENNRMDHRQSYNNGYNSNKNKYSYTTLFQLDSLKNFHIPEDNMNDDGANYTSSSQNGSQENIGYGFLTEHVNGNRPGKSPDLQSEMSHKRKRQNFRGESGYGLTVSREEDSNEEDDEGFFENHISEEHYRNMLGEHVQKIKKARLKGESMNPSGVATAHMGTSNSKRSSNAKRGKVVQENQIALNEMKVAPGIERNSPDIVPFGNEFYKLGSCNKNLANVDGNPNFKSGLLEIADGIAYKIPPVYDMLAPSLNLPTFTTLRVEESILNRKFDSKSLVAMLASKKNNKHLNATRMGEPVTEFSSLQERLKTLKASGVGQNFKLQVFESDFSAIQQDALGTKRLIMSETGMLQYCYVKVLEKGDNFEIIERKLPRKHPVKKDPAIVEKEDFEKVTKLWSHIAKRDISKQFKIFSNHAKKQLNDAKKIADCCQKEVKGKTSRTLKSWKVAAGRVKKLSKDMLMFWRRYEKEQAEIRKKEEKEAAEALKREEELREAKRQQQRLNFLISQTEIYTHFVQNKPQVADDAEEDTVKTPEVDDPEEKAYREEAKRIAKKAAIEQKRMIAAFDNECGNYQRSNSGSGEGVPEGSSNMDLLHPSSMPLTSSVQQPKLFHGTLKEYQLKGLQWLVNCYEQGLNGILADEMGLGKTIQAVAFLAHLAEEKNIWGPFLVVAPASVLNNWADEFTKFCPELNVVPYWGPLGERSVLRKNFNKKQRVYKRESNCHVVITSYNLIHVDEKHLRNVSWQYMVLDEAQAIKNSGSQRWKLFKSFKCRNRLLLTGTPVQNNMAELWSLLHFIMPTLFDSHEQFNEWFSKGIENHAEHGGTLNEHQLSRLHAILKPFMLRRVKKDVITEMTSKREVIVECMLSSRQQAFYQAIKNKISVAELMTNSRGQADDKKVETLMNIVIQLRKVCNHPELFERNEGRTFMYFGQISNTLLPPPFGGTEEVYYAGSRNPISFEIPKKVYRGSLLDEDFRNKCLYHQFQIFSHSNVHASVFPYQAENEINNPVKSGTFGFSRMIDLSPTEVAFVSKGHLLARMLFSVMNWDRKYLDGIIEDMCNYKDGRYCCDHIDEGKVRAVTRLLMMPTRSESGLLSRRPTGHTNGIYLVPLVKSHYDRYFDNIKWLQSIYSFIPPTRALPIDATCSDRRFACQNAEILHNPWVKRLLTGFARTSEFNGPARPLESSYLIQEIDSCVYSTQPLLKLTNRIFGSSPPVQNFDLAKILRDSGKMQTLDALLKRLRAENHRVLLFAQMTKMLNILEDYMNYRKYKYCRLDGQSSIADRRETVKDFQERSDIFVFLLSTRAGGLGINLTAADTVIFYESDWNPTLDLQAMDRAHRLGQTKEVTVYRLICKETIEEKILLRASQKNAVQQLVMTGGHVSGQADGNVMSAEDVLSLLLDDAQELQKLKEQGSLKGKDKHRKRKGPKSVHLNNDGETYSLNGERGTSSKNVPDVASKKRKGNSEKMPSSKRSKKILKDASFTGDAAEQSTEPGVFSIVNSDNTNAYNEEENSSRGWSSPS